MHSLFLSLNKHVHFFLFCASFLSCVPFLPLNRFWVTECDCWHAGGIILLTVAVLCFTLFLSQFTFTQQQHNAQCFFEFACHHHHHHPCHHLLLCTVGYPGRRLSLHRNMPALEGKWLPNDGCGATTITTTTKHLFVLFTTVSLLCLCVDVSVCALCVSVLPST